MESRRSGVGRAAAAAVALVAWTALVLQLVLLLRALAPDLGVAHVLLRYVSYFTILSNLFVACVCSAVALGARGALGGRLTAPRARAAAVLYGAATGGIYVLILRALWSPQGAQWVADVLLHYVVPAAYLAHWLAFAPKRTLVWSDTLRWLAFPALFCAWTLWRGAWAHEYPYPFMDVDALGIALVLRNAAGVAAMLLLLGLVLVSLARALAAPRE